MGFVDWNRIWDSDRQEYIIKPSFFKTDYKAIAVATRTRISGKCGICGRKLVGGEVVVGKDSWTRHCLKCSAKFFAEIREEIKKFEAEIKITEKQLTDNKKKYETKNMLAALK